MKSSPDHTIMCIYNCNIHASAILQYEHKTSTCMKIYGQSCLKVFHILIAGFGTVPEMISDRRSPECQIIITFLFCCLNNEAFI